MATTTIAALASEPDPISESEEAPTTPLDRQLVIVAGKGGVGRSTVAAAIAIDAATAGARVLAVDVVSDGGLAAALGPLSSRFDSASGGAIEVLELSTEEALREYIDIYLRMPISPTRIGPIAGIFDYVAAAAPGVREILTIGKIAYEVREDNWDLVVVDGPATGHCVELLAAADNLSDLIGIGPLVEQTKWVAEILRDPAQTAAVVVTQAEELPVSETVMLLERLLTETEVDIAGIVVNKVPLRVDALGRQALTDLAAPAAASGDALALASHVALSSSDTATEQLERIDELECVTAIVELSADPVADMRRALEPWQPEERGR